MGADSLRVRVETLAVGLEVPWDLDFAPDGRIFLTERAGRIRVIEGDRLRVEPWAELRVFADDPELRPESGLMGIAIDPSFERNGHVYVMATVRKGGYSRAAQFRDRAMRRLRRAIGLSVQSQWENRVYRFTDRNGYATDQRTLVADLPANYYHAGGALRFGPDGMLYLTIGDILDSERAQDPGARVGAILRYRSDGSIPQDNPLPGSPFYAHGLRNSQGLVWDHVTHTLFAIDHGPSFLPHENGRFGRDELNVIAAGGNYGWPVEAGREAAVRFRKPIADWVPAIAPAALEQYDGTRFGTWSGSLLIGGLRSQQLRRITVAREPGAGEGWRVTGDHVALEGWGRIRAVRVGPDGALYVATSNRDGRGQPNPGDDRLLRITPASDN